jgi:hypothetical protein
MKGNDVRVFNPAKKFAEEVLHPLIRSHTDAKLKSRLGAITDEEASLFSPAKRVIKRFNAMKERIVIQQALIMEVKATILINGRKSEAGLITDCQKNLSVLEDQYDQRSDELIETSIYGGKEKPILTEKFKEVGEYLDETYIIIQKLMTKNKLLFFGEDNEFADDEELRERIKNDNRKS